MHPKVVGATAGMEGLDIAWDAQADLEEAMTKGFCRVLSSYDYSKFSDSFEYEWTRQFLLFHGMPRQLVALTHELYTTMIRRIKRGKSVSAEFSQANGFGQGDVMT